MDDDSLKLKDWIPFNIEIDAERFEIFWLKLTGYGFCRSSFSSTIKEHRGLFPNCPIAASNQHVLLEISTLTDSVPPTAFIFHVSRCGSTLISNCLQSIDHSIVISEAQPFNRVLMPYLHDAYPFTYDEYAADYLKWFSALIKIYGNKRIGDEKYYFIKFSSWNALMLSEIKAQFPNVPVIFIFRDPVEVFNSIVARNTGWMKFRSRTKFISAMIRKEPDYILNTSLEKYAIDFLEKLFLSGVNSQKNTLFINYKNDKIENVLAILRFCNIEIDHTDFKKKVVEVSRYHSKDNEKDSAVRC